MNFFENFRFFHFCRPLGRYLLTSALQWFIAATESLAIQLTNTRTANASKFILQPLTKQISDSPQPKGLWSCALD